MIFLGGTGYEYTYTLKNGTPEVSVRLVAEDIIDN